MDLLPGMIQLLQISFKGGARPELGFLQVTRMRHMEME
jgi:hypothetical protein